MLFRDLRSADAKPSAACRIDQFPGRTLVWRARWIRIRERGARGFILNGLGLCATCLMGFNLCLERFRVTNIIAAQESAGDNEVCRKVSVAIAEPDLRVAIVDQLALKDMLLAFAIDHLDLIENVLQLLAITARIGAHCPANRAWNTGKE